MMMGEPKHKAQQRFNNTQVGLQVARVCNRQAEHKSNMLLLSTRAPVVRAAFVVTGAARAHAGKTAAAIASHGVQHTEKESVRTQIDTYSRTTTRTHKSNAIYLQCSISQTTIRNAPHKVFHTRNPQRSEEKNKHFVFFDSHYKLAQANPSKPGAACNANKVPYTS